MEENIQFAFTTRDGTVRTVNVAGGRTIIDAVFELASSILNGDLPDVAPEDIIQITDIPG